MIFRYVRYLNTVGIFTGKIGTAHTATHEVFEQHLKVVGNEN